MRIRREAVIKHAVPARATTASSGRDDSGRQAADGSYKVSVTAPGAGGTATPVPFTIGGTVTGAQRSGNSVSLRLGTLSVDLSAVQSVGTD